MPAGKKPRSVRYESDTGYRPSKSTVEKLRKSVKNYNARVRNAKARFGEFSDIIPDTTSVKDILSRSTSIKDVNSYIKELENIKGEKFQLTALPTGEAITIGELENIESRIKEENRQRRKRERIKVQVEEEEGRFSTQADLENEPITITEKDTFEKLRKKASRYTNYTRALQALRWADIYKEKLSVARFTVIEQGLGSDIIEALDSIEYIIEQLTTTDLISMAAYSPSLDITITSDTVEFINSIDEVLENWETFYSEYIE